VSGGLDLGFLREHGYLVVPDLLPAPELDRWRAEIAGLQARMVTSTPPGVEITWEPDRRPGHGPEILQLLHAELVSSALSDLIGSETILEVAEPVLGADMALYQAKLLMKSGHVGSSVPWHQDFAYWHNTVPDPAMLNAMVYLDDADEENGCLRVVPRSHRRGLLAHGFSATERFGFSLPPHLEQAAVPLPGRAGTVLLFGPLLVHGSTSNASGRPRRACTIVYTVPGNGPGRARLRTAPASELAHLFPTTAIDQVVGIGPHGGQCSGHYRARELRAYALSQVEDRTLAWCRVGINRGGSLEWLAARKPPGTRMFAVDPALRTQSDRSDVVVSPDLLCLQEPEHADALARGLGFVHIQSPFYPTVRDALQALSPGLRTGAVLVIDGLAAAPRALAEFASDAGLAIEFLGRADDDVAVRIAGHAGRLDVSAKPMTWQPQVQGLEVSPAASLHARGSAPTPGQDRGPSSVVAHAVRRQVLQVRRRALQVKWELPPLGRLFPQSRVPRFTGPGEPLSPCPSHDARRALWLYAMSHVDDERLPWAEFGVGAGESLDWFSWHKPTANVLVGFDSFEGIPEPWLNHPIGQWKSAPYASERDDVVIVRGLFEDSLARPEVTTLLAPRLGLVHIDCDLYSSTVASLRGIAPYLGPGTVVIFDEFYGYPGWEQQEGGAFLDFCKEHKVAFEYLARADWQVAVRLAGLGTEMSVACRPFDGSATSPGIAVTMDPTLKHRAAAKLKRALASRRAGCS
jgi:ectoine hydroxylase-related dioxygenase (phytanoyl-CoA dioxygenase family)